MEVKLGRTRTRAGTRTWRRTCRRTKAGQGKEAGAERGRKELSNIRYEDFRPCVTLRVPPPLKKISRTKAGQG